MPSPKSRRRAYVWFRRAGKAALMVVMLVAFGFILSRTEDGPMAIDPSQWWSSSIPEPAGDLGILAAVVGLAFWVGRRNWLE